MIDTKGWRWRNKSAAKIDEEKELEEGQYFDKIKYEIHWTMERLTQHFKTISFHRTITDYSQALCRNGFHITRLVEPKPTTEAVSKYPALEKVLKNPQSLIFEAVKVQDGSRQ